jgi:hypothetical protein
VQTPVRQSVPLEQCFPSAHFGQLPPQSTSVSAPFLIPSTHVAAGGVHTPATQDSSAAQRVPQLPQLRSSLSVFTQAVPHFFVPLGHLHLPSLHFAPVGQHLLPQRLRPGGQCFDFSAPNTEAGPANIAPANTAPALTRA